MPIVSAELFFPSRRSQRLGKEKSFALDVRETRGTPRLTARSVRTASLNDAAESQIGLLCHNDPVDNVDPMGLEENLAQKPISAWDPTGRGFGVDLTISERISLWQKSMETSIGGEQATLTLQSVQIRDALSRQLGQGSFRDQHIEFRPTGKTTTSLAGNPITQGKVIYYVNGKPVAVYPANSGGFKSKNSLVIGNDTRTAAGHYLGRNLITDNRDLPSGMVREDVGFALQLIPLFYTRQSGVYIHPDGPPPGSQGCTALSCGAAGLRDFRARVDSYLSHSPFIDVYVEN